MKKSISVFLAFILIFAQLALTAGAVENDKSDISAECFGSLVRDMLTEYDSGIKAYSISEDEGFSSCRLIVKSAEKIDTCGAISVVSGYKKLWILQYASEEKARSAFEYYQSLECVEYAEPDAEVEMYSVSTESLDKSSLSWGAEAIGADDALNVVSGKNLPEIKVGIIDSGIDYNHEFLEDRVIDEGYNFSTCLLYTSPSPRD